MPSSPLRRLSDLPEYEVARGYPDVRGWALRGHEGTALGTVYELLVDPQALQVLYLDVELEARLATGEFNNHVLLPIEPAVLDLEGRSVFVTALNEQSVRNYPAYDGLQISAEAEAQMQHALGGAAAGSAAGR